MNEVNYLSSNFKEENKNSFYSENREEIMILKTFTGEVLNNIRSGLLDMKVPLQLIKFVLHSRDYENLNLINQRNVRGTSQYFFSFEYPEGMEPFPIPELLLQQYKQPPSEIKKKAKPEKNFIVLTELVGKNGVLTNFVPSLKSVLAEKIKENRKNRHLNAALINCEKLIQIAENIKKELYIPKLSERGTRNSWLKKGAQDIFNKAQTNVEQILKNHKGYVIDPILEQKIDNYTEEVKKRNINEYKIKDR